MKALVKNRRERGLDYMEIPVPDIGSHDVLVRVRVAAICGTDMNSYLWNEWAVKVYTKIPFIPGHECSAEVVETGREVTFFRKGDRVSIETHVPCKKCYHCLTGMEHICPAMKLIGATMDGCFAEYCIVPDVSLRKVPDGLSWEEAALLEPMGIPLRAVHEGNVAGDTVAVIGCGPIGLFAIGLSKITGASKVYALDRNTYRLDIAKNMGADRVINPEEAEPSQLILEDTRGLGVGVVIEASGAAEAIRAGFKYLRKGGKVFLIGQPKTKVELDWGTDLVLKEARVRGFHGREMFKTWQLAEELLLTKRIDIKTIVTHRFPMKDYLTAYELLLKGEACKVLFDV
jgi:threonine 3-dehydrogenase